MIKILSFTLYLTKTKGLNTSTSSTLYTEFRGGSKMPNITLSISEELHNVVKEHNEIK